MSSALQKLLRDETIPVCAGVTGSDDFCHLPCNTLGGCTKRIAPFNVIHAKEACNKDKDGIAIDIRYICKRSRELRKSHKIPPASTKKTIVEHTKPIPKRKDSDTSSTSLTSSTSTSSSSESLEYDLEPGTMLYDNKDEEVTIQGAGGNVPVFLHRGNRCFLNGYRYEVRFQEKNKWLLIKYDKTGMKEINHEWLNDAQFHRVLRRSQILSPYNAHDRSLTHLASEMGGKLLRDSFWDRDPIARKTIEAKDYFVRGILPASKLNELLKDLDAENKELVSHAIFMKLEQQRKKEIKEVQLHNSYKTHSVKEEEKKEEDAHQSYYDMMDSYYLADDYHSSVAAPAVDGNAMFGEYDGTEFMSGYNDKYFVYDRYNDDNYMFMFRWIICIALVTFCLLCCFLFILWLFCCFCGIKKEWISFLRVMKKKEITEIHDGLNKI